jgi:hypothetical protein
MRRPFVVTAVAVAVLLLAAFNLLRLVEAANRAELLRSLGLDGPLAALIATGAVWAIGFGAAGIGLYRLKRWAWRWTLIASVLYQANDWLIRLAFEKSATDAQTRGVDALFSLFSVIFVWAILLLPRVRQAFSVTSGR